jgi:hypothetical protein
LADGARSIEVVTKVIALGSALRKRLPRSVGINLNVVAKDASGARACLPRDSGIASSRSGGDNSSSGSGGHGVDSRGRPLADGASFSSHLEGDGISTAVKVVAEVVKREAVRVNTLVDSIVEVNILVLSISRAVLELVSQAAVSYSVSSPVDIHAVSGRIQLNRRASNDRSGDTGKGEGLSSSRSSSSLSSSK